MTSKIVMIMSIIVIIIISSEAASISRPGGVAPIFEDICPILGSEEYQVTVIGLDSKHIGGCAFIEHKSTESKNQKIKKSFSMWIGELHHGKRRCREQGMKQFHFPCQSESTVPSKDFTKGKVYVHWHGQIISNEQSRRNFRCALIEMVKGNNTLFRMAISENHSCSGLLDLLSQPQPKVPEKIILMQLNKASESHESYQLRLRRSITYSNDTIKKSFTDGTSVFSTFFYNKTPFEQ